jgi:hypothetical protein
MKLGIVMITGENTKQKDENGYQVTLQMQIEHIKNRNVGRTGQKVY